MSGQNDLIKDDDEVVVYEVKELIGTDCRTSSVTGSLTVEGYTTEYEGKRTLHKSLQGCIHLCDGSGLATWSFYDSNGPRLVKSAIELEKMAAHLIDFAAAIRKVSDQVGEFDVKDQGT
jgi:hypothetical protein